MSTSTALQQEHHHSRLYSNHHPPRPRHFAIPSLHAASPRMQHPPPAVEAEGRPRGSSSSSSNSSRSSSSAARSPSMSRPASRASRMQSPPLKRATREESAEERGASHKVPKMEGEADVTTGAGAGPPSSPPSQPHREQRNYTWQPPSSAATGSLMSITTISSPVRSGGGGVGGGSSTAQERTHFSPLPSRSRLPGIASLSARPTSPPPQVARVNAPRSFVAANPGPSSNVAMLATRSAFPSSSSSPRSTTALPPITTAAAATAAGPSTSAAQYGSGSLPTPLQPAGSASPSLTAQQLSGCPPIHPALTGLPGSGSGPGNKQQPSFVAKLYSMLEDEATGEMITWGPQGDVFSVANPAEFSRVVLPVWFKHANWQSFVRQLNMYGFHKVNHTFSGAPNEEVQIWEFKHPSFRRGEVALLAEIKRKSSRHKRTGSTSQSFSGSLHGVDFDGTMRSRSSTPVDPYEAAGALPPGYMGGEDPRYAARPDFGAGEAFPGQHPAAHARVRSLTDAAMRGERAMVQQQQQQQQQRAPMSNPAAAAWGAPLPSGHAKAASIAIGPPPSHPSYAGGAESGPSHVNVNVEQGDPTGEGASAGASSVPDRIDAIIRHSDYLEKQVRALSDNVRLLTEELHAVSREEATGKAHLLRLVHRLAGVVALSPNANASAAGASSGGQEAAQRRQMLDVYHSEITSLAHYLGIDTGFINVTAGSGGGATAPGSMSSPPPLPATAAAAAAAAGAGGSRTSNLPPPPPPRAPAPHHRAGAGGSFSFPRR